MLPSYSGLVAGATFLISSVSAFSASSTSNVAVYWGQNSAGSQGTLASYCQDSTIDIIPISFLVAFGTGSYSLNFANMCGGSTIAGSTLIQCDQIAADIKTCQAAGKKILLSMGGASGAYGFSSAAQAVQIANDMWNYFGGGSSSIRPFGTSTVDGFDLDIENNNPAYYPDFITQLRSLYASQSAKTYYISGAPQCVYPDASLKDALAGSWFDFLFIQFYNNYCGLYQYGSSSGAFNYNVWDTWAKTVSVNKNVKLYLGVAASIGAANAGTGYVAPSVMEQAAKALQSEYPASFGGIMMWDASQAYANVPSGYSINYAQIAKQALGATVVASSAPSTTPTSSIKTTTPAGNVATTQKAATTTTTTPAVVVKPSSSSAAPVAVASGCTKQYTVASGDYCYAIWTKYGLSSDTFYALNPTLSKGDNCLIQPGQVLCVGNTGATQSPSTTAQPTTTSTTTVKVTSTSTTTVHVTSKSPSSTAAAAATASVAAGCTQQYTVVTGDYCYAIWTKYGLSSDAFYALNPTLSAANNCAIQPGQVLCVSKSAQTTTANKAAATTAAASTGGTCPVSGGACAEGSYQCNGYGYAQCVFGAWMLRACPSGTACAGSGSNIYCDWPGTAAVTCSGIAGKTNSKRSVLEETETDIETLESEVKTSMTSQRLNATHFVLTLRAHTTGITPISNDWYFTFQSEKDILESDRGVLYRDALDGSYTVSADPLSDDPPTRTLSIRLTGTYETLITIQRQNWLW